MEDTILQNVDTLKSALGIETKANEAMHSTQAGFGDEYVPTEMAANVIEAARDRSTILGEITNIWDMPTNPFTVPVEGDDAAFYLTDEEDTVTGTDVTRSKVGTSLLTLTAKKFSASVFLTSELIEDAKIAGGIRSHVERQLGKKFAEVVDNVILNGDVVTAATGNINSDNAARTAGTPDLAFDGLRKAAFAGTKTLDVGVLDSGDFMAVRALLGGKYGANPQDLLIIMNPETYYKTQTLAQLQGIDTFGGAATLQNGVLQYLYGIKVVVSSQFGLTEADGKINTSAGLNTKGGFLVVYKPAMNFGWKRKLQLHVEFLPRVDQYCITAHSRLSFGLARAGMAALGFNATV